MFGYTKEDLDNMLTAIWSAQSAVDSEKDPKLYNDLYKAGDFLNSIWSEGYFD